MHFIIDMRDDIFVLQAERDRVIKEQQEQQEEFLAAELSRIDMEKQRDEKMRQQIRENRLVFICLVI